MSPGAPPESAVNATTLRTLADRAAAELAAVSDSPRLDAELLLGRAAGLSRSAIYASPERIVEVEARARFTELVALRRNDVPVAYLLGEREFYSLRLEVDPAVLVPRPETELLVDTALGLLARRPNARVLDLGTGCGAVALAIKHERPDAEVTGVDESPAALSIAGRNAAVLGLSIALLESDWFAAVADRRFDLIVSNPPYVASGDPLLRGPLRHEPAAALDGGPDGFDAIRHIVRAAAAHLAPHGVLVVEHGETQGAAARALAGAAGYRDVRTLRDIAGRERALVAEAT